MAPSRNFRSPVFVALAATLAAGITLGLAPLRHSSSVLAARAAAKKDRPAPQAAHHFGGNPVIVELFTSEGCSSCPPADALLAKLQQDQPIPSADIITLEEHVDYWDHLGWRDRFSSPTITQRQQNYAKQFRLDEVYTPQFVVNGSSQFDGTDPSAINAAIVQAAANTVPLQLTSVKGRYSSPAVVTFTLANGPTTHSEYVRLYAVLVDPKDDTAVHAGENGGRTLHHVDTVRTIAMLGDARHMNDLGKKTFSISVPAGANLIGLRLIVFAQTNPFGPIVGSAIRAITADNIDRTSLSTRSAQPPLLNLPGPDLSCDASCGMPSPQMNVP